MEDILNLSQFRTEFTKAKRVILIKALEAGSEEYSEVNKLQLTTSCFEHVITDNNGAA